MVEGGYKLTLKFDDTSVRKELDRLKREFGSVPMGGTGKFGSNQMNLGSGIGSTFADMRKDFQANNKIVNRTSTEMLGGIMGIAKSVLPIVGIGIGIAAISKTLIESSGYLKGTLEVLNASFSVLFKPFGDFVAALLMPLALSLMDMAVKFNKNPNVGKAVDQALDGEYGAALGSIVTAAIDELVPGVSGTSVQQRIIVDYENIKAAFTDFNTSLSDVLNGIFGSFLTGIPEAYADAGEQLTSKIDPDMFNIMVDEDEVSRVLSEAWAKSLTEAEEGFGDIADDFAQAMMDRIDERGISPSFFDSAVNDLEARLRNLEIPLKVKFRAGVSQTGAPSFGNEAATGGGGENYDQYWDPWMRGGGGSASLPSATTGGGTGDTSDPFSVGWDPSYTDLYPAEAYEMFKKLMASGHTPQSAVNAIYTSGRRILPETRTMLSNLLAHYAQQGSVAPAPSGNTGTLSRVGVSSAEHKANVEYADPNYTPDLTFYERGEKYNRLNEFMFALTGQYRDRWAYESHGNNADIHKFVNMASSQLGISGSGDQKLDSLIRALEQLVPNVGSVRDTFADEVNASLSELGHDITFAIEHMYGDVWKDVYRDADGNVLSVSDEIKQLRTDIHAENRWTEIDWNNLDLGSLVSAPLAETIAPIIPSMESMTNSVVNIPHIDTNTTIIAERVNTSNIILDTVRTLSVDANNKLQAIADKDMSVKIYSGDDLTFTEGVSA